jgi:phosphatidylglycerophosphatase A
MKNGLGVMLDDLVAAIYAIVVLLAIQYLLD